MGLIQLYEGCTLESLNGKYGIYYRLTKTSADNKKRWLNLSTWTWEKLCQDGFENIKEILKTASIPFGEPQEIRLTDRDSIDVHEFSGRLYVGFIQKKNENFTNRMNLASDKWEDFIEFSVKLSLQKPHEINLVIDSTIPVESKSMPKKTRKRGLVTPPQVPTETKRRKKWPTSIVTYSGVISEGVETMQYITEEAALSVDGVKSIKKTNVAVPTSIELITMLDYFLVMEEYRNMRRMVCEGCTNDYPSQRDHPCLMDDDDVVSRYPEVRKVVTFDVLRESVQKVFNELSLPIFI